MKIQVKGKARFSMNQSSKKSNKYPKNQDNEASQKLHEASKKRTKIICENLVDKSKDKSYR